MGLQIHTNSGLYLVPIELSVREDSEDKSVDM